MKTSFKRYFSLVMVFALVITAAFAFSAQSADAASGPIKLGPRTYWVGEESWGAAPYEPVKDDNWEVIDKAKLISVSSSAPKVLKAVRDKADKTLYGYYLQPRKVGKSTVTIKYKVGKKSYSMKKVYYVKKYPSPIKAVKVNGAAVKIAKNKFSYDKSKYKKNTASVKLTPAKGWNVIYAYVTLYNQKTNKDSYKELKPAAVKKGTSFKIPKGYDAYCFVTLQNSKEEVFEYAVRFFRGE